MRQRIFFIVLAVLTTSAVYCQKAQNPHGLQLADRNPGYKDVVAYYKAIDAQYSSVLMKTVGTTDTDDSLQVVYYTNDGAFNRSQWQQNRVVVFINNGIHPGEPDGIVASMQLLWDITHDKTKLADNIVLAIIPAFNISGATRLREYTRANQNGPKLTGFRGNAQNLDLNRDFIKTEAKETRSLVQLFQYLDPDILVDNHVSNGADYQHIMTLLSTQHSKLGGPMGKYLHDAFEPALYADMKKKNLQMVPYVNVWHGTPENGWEAFLENPRFLSGYAAMFNTYAFVAETHMLKPYPDRVHATYQLMESIITHATTHYKEIKDSRKQQQELIMQERTHPLEWKVDTAAYDMVEMQGYNGGQKTSNLSGQQRLYYDKDKPYTTQVHYYNSCTSSCNATVPTAYIIPQGWGKVIQRLKQSGVMMKKMEQDTMITLTVYYITDYQTTPKPYEGHYLHSKVKAEARRLVMDIRKGDYYIPVQQHAKRYIVETLQPEAPDAFFAWGFFDAVLQQKEWYSDYAFEDIAPTLLKQDKALAEKLAQRRKEDPVFARDGAAQLEFVFQNSKYHEPEHMRYPVYRLE